jgi:3-methyl-2-oxobutanoate hydroxymethyltransferase
VRAKSREEADKLVEDAKALEEAGCFAVVLEKIPRALAKTVSTSLRIPTIGIGSGPDCDGQILVNYDLLGIFDKFRPKFVRHYVEGAQVIRDAVGSWVNDVREGTFPSPSESYDASPGESRTVSGSKDD